jgi:hypothetical protein
MRRTKAKLSREEITNAVGGVVWSTLTVVAQVGGPSSGSAASDQSVAIVFKERK